MSLLDNLYRWFELPHRIQAIFSHLGRAPDTVLDAGCGNHSPTLTKKYFPCATYHGIDVSAWNNTSTDVSNTDHLFTIDLENTAALLNTIPSGFYDAVICSHVLEHLANPYDTLSALAQKVREGGVMYIESPNSRSLRLPSARRSFLGIHGCLNFYDDPTHKTLVDMREAEATTTAQGLTTLALGQRRLKRRIVLLPLYMAAGIATRGYVPASVVWDVAGFADCLVAMRLPQQETTTK